MSKTKNWINFCGVSSDEISGLLINSLPPIQMPPKKTNVINIEGRDGDIVEVLGYEAYDKTVNISLKNDYDVDEVIRWLNNSGDLILSNEPDKVYKAAVYDTVAFERLLKFKQASVKFHVQPFKTLKKDCLQFEYEGVIGDFEVTVTNRGNIYSRPKISADVSGGGRMIYVYVNDIRYFILITETMPNILNIDFETGIIEAYDFDSNKIEISSIRYETDSLPSLNPGENTIKISTLVNGFTNPTLEVFNASRWL